MNISLWKRDDKVIFQEAMKNSISEFTF